MKGECGLDTDYPDINSATIEVVGIDPSQVTIEENPDRGDYLRNWWVIFPKESDLHLVTATVKMNGGEVQSTDTPFYDSLPPAVNLIVNGSFEDSAPIPNSGILQTPNLPGWTIAHSSTSSCTDPAAGVELFNDNWVGIIDPIVGGQAVELDSNCDSEDEANVKISQTIETVIGMRYRFSMKIGARGGNDGDQVIRAGMGSSKAFDTIPLGLPVGNWIPITQTFIATETATTIVIEDRGDADTVGTPVDDIQVVWVPAN